MIPGRDDDSIAGFIRSSTAGVAAPEGLRARIEADRARAQRPARRIGFVAAAASALAALITVALLAGGTGPTVQEVAAAGLQPPTRPAPAVDAGDPALLDISVDDLAFPSWREPWGWRAVGVRSDTVDGREAITVVYREGRRGVHYSIVAGEPLPWPQEGEVIRQDGRRLVALDGGPVDVVTWRQDGRTCILASDTVGVQELAEQALWR